MALTRDELFRKLGVVKYGPQIDALTHNAYVDHEMRVWKENLESAPHGHPWHTSFHGSSFPGSEKSCGRAAIYTLMDIPNAEPAPPMLRATAEIGKAAENQILVRWGQAGLMIAGTPPQFDGDKGWQQQFADEDTWLTGSIDAILGIPEFSFVLPVDIKSKPKEVIDQMKIGVQGYYPDHYAQVQGYIYLCRKFYNTMTWEHLGFKPPIGAIIYYVSRENPRHTHEFFVDADEEFIERGVANLLSWKESFLNGKIPERDKSWKWTEDPCKWCKFKKFACKPDNKEKITNIDQSKSIEFAKSLREYDIEKVKKGVLERWS